MKAAAIIAAAGIGRRMGGDRPKQYLELSARPIICHTLDRFLKSADIDEVIIVVEPGRERVFTDDIIEAFDYPRDWKVVAGGEVRQESIKNGLAAVSDDIDVVLVHDGVRPFITGEQIQRLAEVAFEDGACILADPLKETIKRVSDGVIVETVDRSALWGAGTPQAFRTKILREAMSAAIADGFVGTDEAGIVERIGKKVIVIEGGGRNIKITTPADLAIAEAILAGWKG